MVRDKDNRGSTLLEVLIAFSIFLVLASLLPPIIRQIAYQPKQLQHIETSLFFQQLQLEVHKSTNAYVANNTLYLRQRNNLLVSYGQIQRRIRRQVNGAGQEIVLQDVLNVSFSIWQNSINVSVTDSYNHVHEKVILQMLPFLEEWDASS